MATARHGATNRREWQVLTALHAFMGVGAIGGGVALISGSSGMPERYLDGSPFSSYAIPGLALAVVVGGSSLLAAWTVWRQSDSAIDRSLLASVVLAGWFVVQIAAVGLISWLQPVLIALLIVQAGLALQLRSRQH